MKDRHANIIAAAGTVIVIMWMGVFIIGLYGGLLIHPLLLLLILVDFLVLVPPVFLILVTVIFIGIKDIVRTPKSWEQDLI